MTFRIDTPAQIHNDQILPPDLPSNAAGQGAADRARQQMMARDAANSGKPHWTAKGNTVPNQKKDQHIEEVDQLKKDGLDQQNPNADKAREAMVRRQNAAASKPGDISKG